MNAEIGGVKTQTGFSSTLNRGFVIRLGNGVHVSVQFGRINYCSVKTMLHKLDTISPQHCDVWNSPNAEITIYRVSPDGDKNITKEFNPECDGQIGWVQPDDLSAILQWAMTK